MLTYKTYIRMSFHDLDAIFCFLWWRSDLNHKNLFKRLLKAKLMVVCLSHGKIVWFWCLKKITKSKKDMIQDNHFFSQKITRKNCLESWFFYTHPVYRWLGIASNIQKKILYTPTNHVIISATRTDNISMQNILKKNSFLPIGDPYFNDFLKKNMQLYVHYPLPDFMSQ